MRVALTEEQKEEALRRGNADLKFLFERNEVPRDVIAGWVHAGVTTLEKFANTAKDVNSGQHSRHLVVLTHIRLNLVRGARR